MSYLGMAENVAKAAFEPTPDFIAEQCQYLLSLPQNNFVVLDPSFGIGALVKPIAEHPSASILGFEIAGDRATLGQQAVPRAKVYHSDVLRASLSPEAISLLLANPPYLEQDARRIEYHIFHHIFQKRWLMPDAVVVAIMTMRQWKSHIVDLFARYCYDIQAFKLPDPEFDRFKQGVIVARMRRDPLTEPDQREKARLHGWYYDADRAREGKQPWRQGFPLPTLPDRPGIVTYTVPPTHEIPEVTLKKAPSDMIREKLKDFGIHKSTEWRDAITYDRHQFHLLPPLMPLIGKAHLAALILSGILDGQILQGSDGNHYIFSSFISAKWEDAAIDDEEKMKNVVKKRQLQDLPVLGVLTCETGETAYYHGSKAYQYLDPWLALLAQKVLKEHRPRYDLANFDEWMLREAAKIGNDKQLPGAQFPGLALAQLHRVFAHWIAFNALGKDAFQGEPGTGKTRMLITLMALMAHYWKQRDEKGFLQQQGTQRRPRWVKGVKVAWRANKWTKGDAPKALPLAIVTPKRVIKSTWEGEFAKAWPDAKTVVIHSHQDVKRWMELCADGYCYESDGHGKQVKRTFPAVVALFSQSTTRPSRLQWGPCVIEVKAGTKVVPDLHAQGERVYDGLDKLIGKKDPDTGEVVKKEVAISHFYCPDCHRLIQATPRSLMKQNTRTDVDTDVLEELEIEEKRPVEHIDWFEQQPRWCQNERPEKERRGSRRSRDQEQICGAPLWAMQRIPVIEKKFPHVPYAVWAQGITHHYQMGAGGEKDSTQDASDKKRHSQQGHTQKGTSPATLSNERRLSSTWSRINDPSGLFGELPPDSFSPYDYYKHFFRNCCAFVGIDESHNAQAPNSHISRAIHHIMQACQTRMLASGTHYPGTLERFFYYWFRFAPEFWLRLGITWKMVHRAIREFGVLVQTTRERTITKKGLAEKEQSTTTKAAPGVSSRLLPLLLSLMCYIDVLDVGAHMPKRRQIPVIVDMHDEGIEEKRQHLRAELEKANEAKVLAETSCDNLAKQEGIDERELDLVEFELSQAVNRAQDIKAHLDRLDAIDLAAGYTKVEDDLLARAQKGNATAQMMLGMLPRWWVIAPFAPAFTITQNEKGDWGEDIGSQIIFSAPTLSEDHEYPLEQAVRKHVDAELQEIAEGSDPPRRRRVMIYYEQTTKRDVGARYAKILKDYTPWVLPDQIEPEDREDAIREAVEAGHNVILVAYKKVSEGLNLQFLDTIMWIEMPMNLILFDQAGRRIWRLNKVEECREYIFAYTGTVAHKKMKKLASESGAASLFMGNSPIGELAALVGADQTALAQVARKLDSVEDLAAAFAARDKELEAVLAQGREWLGIENGDPLPDRYSQARAANEAEQHAVVREAERIVRDAANLSDPPLYPQGASAETGEETIEPVSLLELLGLGETALSPHKQQTTNEATSTERKRKHSTQSFRIESSHLFEEQPKQTKDELRRKQEEEQKRSLAIKDAKAANAHVDVRYIPSLSGEDERDPAVSVAMMMDLWGEMVPAPSGKHSRKWGRTTHTK